MNRFLLFPIFLFFAYVSYTQDGDELIAWSADRPLTWEDFQGKPEKRSDFDALTSASFGFNYKYVSGQNYRFVISVGFDPEKSWVKMENATDELLNHEQGHFDINEIFARYCIKELKEVKVKNMDKFGKVVEKTFDRIGREMSKFQDEYDRETDHSKVRDKQIEWNKKIARMLKETEAYSFKEIAVELD